ncbi:hypothetical protein Chls_239 [Chlamydia suis]|uniref:Uncharacterized protein n=1 Tax=Chlamydia suis TaxID=83559 RepID=A0ABX6IPV1_9CHLA|nr:hypothetical protein Chls_239 [Chlamydia suis]
MQLYRLERALAFSILIKGRQNIMRKIQKIHGQINEPLHTNKDLKIFRG